MIFMNRREGKDRRNPENSIINKEIDLKVEFPFNVTKENVDKLIKNEEGLNQSLLAIFWNKISNFFYKKVRTIIEFFEISIY